MPQLMGVSAMANHIEKVYSEFLRETFYYVKHQSGLKIVFVPKDFTSYYAMLGVNYGSVDSSFRYDEESSFKKVPDGIAHYLEHKMFENEDGTDAFAAFSKLGANANAFTTNNLTAYLFSCTSNFEENLAALLDFVRKPYFTEENVEKERGIISEEIEMYEDDPYSALHYGMLGLLYHDHSIKINVAGTVDSVSEITPEHLYRCYNAFYRLENMVLSVSGNTDIESIVSICDRVLSKDKECSLERAPLIEPDSVFKSRGEEYRLVSNPLFCIGVKDIVASDNKERARRTIAASILVDALFGPSSDFFSKLYSEGKINSMSCGYDSMINYAFSYIIGECKDPEAVYDEFRGVIERALVNGLNLDDFNRIKKVSIANFVKNYDSTESIANDALYLTFDGILPHEYARLLSDVDYEYTNDLLLDFYDEKKCAMMTVFPKRKEDVNNG